MSFPGPPVIPPGTFTFPAGVPPLPGGPGIPVFNAPFANTRSVAELIIGEIICLARQLGDRSREIHSGVWNKVSTGACEVCPGGG